MEVPGLLAGVELGRLGRMRGVARVVKMRELRVGGGSSGLGFLELAVDHSNRVRAPAPFEFLALGRNRNY